MGRAKRPVRAHPGQLYHDEHGGAARPAASHQRLRRDVRRTGQEDVHLGLRIGQTGAPILYDRSMMIVESDDLNHAGAPLVRHDPWMHEDRYLERLGEFGVHRRPSKVAPTLRT
jgi:hypothetical protein